ncbi:MAG TPA: UDP binding domain-containing protein [Chloroflexota bacterium]|jgi:nucleotide sugar dehydrogenase|nr:UDP binding domain-containing protein [Chloroflexota bacterium]
MDAVIESSKQSNQGTDELLRCLRTRETSVAVWGTGAIGSSATFHFARAGFRLIGYDISAERVKEVQEGRFQSTAAQMLGDEVKTHPDLGVSATTKWRDLNTQRVAVHLVCVPTERAAEPSGAALADVVPRVARVVKKTKIAGIPPIVSIESTILPSWIDEIVIPGLESEGLTVGDNVLLGAAPRRDWFNGASHTIENLPRIVGGCDERTTILLAAFYATVCEVVQPAMDAQHAAFTKVIENVVRYEGITFGNRLALAFPRYDMRHVLGLASTKWNIPYYFPSFGIGGHCIPLAPQYLVKEGGEANHYLDSVRDSIAFNDGYFSNLYADRLRQLLAGKRSVGVLGLAYTPDAKMHKLSPAFDVLETLRDTPRLLLHDPFYSADEIYDLCSVPKLHVPDDIADCDALILVTAHTDYVDLEIENLVHSGTVIIDSTGAWTDRRFPEGVEYYEVGRVRGRPGPVAEPHSSTAD